MKKLVMMFFAVVVVLGLGMPAQAGEEYTIKGEVVSIDSEGKTIVIDTTEGQKTVVFQETTKGFSEAVKPGASVKMTCIDLEGKACAHDIEVISAREAATPTKVFEGEVVSIDPGGKAVVIKSPKGEEMTIEVHEGAMVEKVAPMEGAVMSEEMLAAEPMTMEELTPGMQVKMVCFDSGEKFCANRITAVSVEEAQKPVPEATEVVGEVVSLDPDNKAVLIKTVEKEKTLYYQKVTGGVEFDKLELGKKVKAYCYDVAGKTCIKDIYEVE